MTVLRLCWAGRFGDLVAAANHNSAATRKVWLDIFAVHQHVNEKMVSAPFTLFSNGGGKWVVADPLSGASVRLKPGGRGRG